MTPDIGAVVSAAVRDVPDFPEPGVLFKDFTPLLADPVAFRALVRDIAGRYAGQVDKVAGIEARGFILGAAVAYELRAGFVPVRKVGKLPGRTYRAAYQLEYGSAELELHQDAFGPGERVLVIDDVLATGGTAATTCELVERAQGQVVAVEALLEIVALGGRARLGGRTVHAVVTT